VAILCRVAFQIVLDCGTWRLWCSMCGFISHNNYLSRHKYTGISRDHTVDKISSLYHSKPIKIVISLLCFIIVSTLVENSCPFFKFLDEMWPAEQKADCIINFEIKHDHILQRDLCMLHVNKWELWNLLLLWYLKDPCDLLSV